MAPQGPAGGNCTATATAMTDFVSESTTNDPEPAKRDVRKGAAGGEATAAALRGRRGAQLLLAGALAWQSGADAMAPAATPLDDGAGVDELLASSPDAPAESQGSSITDAAPDAAQTVGGVDAVSVDAPWARATVGPSRPGAVYLEIRNDGNAPAVLAGVEVDVGVAAGASLHRTVTDAAGASRMAPVDELTIPTGTSVAFEPGGLHVMLEGLREPLAKGRTVVLTLRLSDGATLDVEVPVLDAAARGPEGADR